VTKLNTKQKLFCIEYIKDFNATQAAIRAGYSRKTAGSSGHNLLKNIEIQREISEATKERTEKTKIDAEWVLTRLAEEAKADIADIYSDDGGLKPVKDWPLIWRQGLVSGIDSHQEYDYVNGEKVPAGVVQKIRLSDRVKRLELIGKHVDVQAFADKVALAEPHAINLVINRPESGD
jgi:phage terminase small subunit